MFPPVAYIEWSREHVSKGGYDFASSDLGRQFEGAVPGRLEALPEPEEDVTLESRIADAYGPSIEPTNVLVTAGSTQANFLAAAVALDEWGDSVLIESPFYEPLEATPGTLGATTSHVVREPPRYQLNPTLVDNAADTRTALVTVTNRHNPSGRLLSRGTLGDVAAVADSYGASLLVDEVYAPFEISPKAGTGTAFGGVTAAGLDRTLASSSLTKFFGFDPLRIGWLIGQEMVIDRARSVETHLLATADVSRRLAQRVFAAIDTVTERSRAIVTENQALLADFLDHRDDLDGLAFPGSTMAFPAHRSASGDAVTQAALAEDVLVVPGRFFGRPDRFRLALGGEPTRMQTGLEKLGAALDSLETSDGLGAA